MIAAIILCVIIVAYIYYDPYVDITKNKIFLWYNKGDNRECIVLWSKET